MTAGDDTPVQSLGANLSNQLQGTFQIISAEPIKLHFFFNSATHLRAEIIEAGDSWSGPVNRHNKPTRADNSRRAV